MPSIYFKVCVHTIEGDGLSQREVVALGDKLVDAVEADFPHAAVTVSTTFSATPE